MRYPLVIMIKVLTFHILFTGRPNFFVLCDALVMSYDDWDKDGLGDWCQMGKIRQAIESDN